MNPEKAKELILDYVNHGIIGNPYDFKDALSLTLPALDLMEKVTTLDSPGRDSIWLIQCYCVKCLNVQWHIITIKGNLECLGCRAGERKGVQK